jgi:hypothetical protein
MRHLDLRFGRLKRIGIIRVMRARAIACRFQSRTCARVTLSPAVCAKHANGASIAVVRTAHKTFFTIFSLCELMTKGPLQACFGSNGAHSNAVSH